MGKYTIRIKKNNNNNNKITAKTTNNNNKLSFSYYYYYYYYYYVFTSFACIVLHYRLSKLSSALLVTLHSFYYDKNEAYYYGIAPTKPSIIGI